MGKKKWGMDPKLARKLQNMEGVASSNFLIHSASMSKQTKLNLE